MFRPLRSRKSRRTKVIALVGAAAAVLAACSPGSSTDSGGGPVTLTFQTWVPNMQAAVDAFNDSHPDITVTLETITAGPNGGYAKMLSAVQAGDPADVAQVGYDEMPTFVLNDALTDITSYVSEDEAKYTAWQWDANVFGGRVYGIPQASGPVGQFYRADVLDELGLDAPTTWEEYYEAARTIHAADEDTYITAFAANQPAWVEALAQQAGQPWFTVEGDSWKVAIDNPDTLKMAAYWQKMLDEDLVKVEPDMSNEWYKDIQSGNVVTWMSGSWAAAIISGNAPKTSGLWAASEMPQWTAGSHTAASWGGGSSNVVLKGSDHPQEAAEFADWLNGTPQSQSLLNSAGAGWPSLADTSQVESLTDDSESEEFFGGQNISEVFSVADQNISQDWRFPPLNDTLNALLTDNLQTAVQGGTTLAQALQKTQTQFVAALEAKGISVVS